MIIGRNSPARTFLAFLLVLFAAMLFAAIASPWVQMLLGAQFPLHRVFSRLTLLGWIGGTAWLLLRAQLARAAVLGFNRPWPRFLQRILWGWVAGIALMAVALVPLFLLGLREWNSQLPGSFATLLPLLVKALGSGLLVALLEEPFFRGAMQGALQRQGARCWALFAVPLLYSAVHFLGGAPNEPTHIVNAWSGFDVWAGLFSSFSNPLHIADAFVALYFVGLLLALVRERWGDLAGCIGLHAGFVGVIAVFRKVSTPAPDSPWSFLVGDFDGLLGIWIAALTAVICMGIWRMRPRPLA
jgi:membrane protease YdiL (CAAX protease family)